MRRRFPILLAVVALLTGAYAIFWHYASGLVRDGLEEWREARLAEGYRIEYAEPEIDGFPLAIRVHVARPLIAAPALVWQWSGERIETQSRPWAFRRVAMRPEGWHQFNIVIDGKVRQAAIRAADAEAVAVFRLNGRLEEANLSASGLELISDWAGGSMTAESAHLVATPAKAPGTAPGNTRFDLKLRVEEAVLTEKLAGALGRELRWLDLDAAVNGAVPYGPPVQALTEWRNGGGTIDVKGFHLGWGPLNLSTNGTIALDDELQPKAMLTAKIRGFAETVDALITARVMRARDGKLAKGVLGLLARRPEGGGEPELTTPITTRNRMLYAGPVGLVRLPVIRWAE